MHQVYQIQQPSTSLTKALHTALPMKPLLPVTRTTAQFSGTTVLLCSPCFLAAARPDARRPLRRRCLERETPRGERLAHLSLLKAQVQHFSGVDNGPDNDHAS